MPLQLLRGPRLGLRPAGLCDLDFLADLNGDAAVMAHISGGPVGRSETEDEWARRLGRRSSVDEGLGYWVGVVDARPIGWWGLGRSESAPGSGELGFRVRSDHWRQGYGAEGARVLIDHAFGGLAVSRVWAGTVTSNAASRATLQSVGLRQTQEPRPGVLTYEMTRAEWLDRSRGPAVH